MPKISIEEDSGMMAWHSADTLYLSSPTAEVTDKELEELNTLKAASDLYQEKLSKLLRAYYKR